MYNTQITIADLRKKLEGLPEDTVVGRVKGNGSLAMKNFVESVEPYTDWDVNGDQYLFQVDPQTGIFVLGYDF